MNMAGALTEAILSNLFILNTEANLGSQIAKLTTEVKDLLAHCKKLEANVAIVRNVNSQLVERVVATKHQCWENAQYSRRDTLEVIGIPMSVRDDILEQMVCDMFQGFGVDICDRDIQTCNCLKDKDQKIVKFTNRKYCLRNLRVNPYYRGIWNKCKKLGGKQKVHKYYTINGSFTNLFTN